MRGAWGPLLLCCFMYAVGAAEGISEWGNTADNDSNIIWGDISTNNSDYKATDDGSQGALSLYYNLASSFTRSSLPANIEKIMKFKKDLEGPGGFSIPDLLQKVLDIAPGYVLSLVLGLLFLLVFPFVGCCFCCCRCCNNCGGKMLQKQRPNDNCKRIVFSIVLFLLALLTGVAMVCMYATNDQAKDSLEELPAKMTDVLDDTVRFLNNTKSEVKHLVVNNFNFTKRVLFRDLDNIGAILGEPVQEEMNQQGVSKVLAAVNNLSNNVDTIGTDLMALNTNLTQLRTYTQELEHRLDGVRRNITAVRPGIPGITQLTIKFNASKLPDITSEMAKVQRVKAMNLTDQIQDGKKEFDNIPELVKNMTLGIVKSIKRQVSNFSNSIDSELKPILELTDEIGITKILDSVKAMISKYGDTVTYTNARNYMWIAGQVLPSIVLLVLLCLVCGLCCGTCGFRRDVDPTHRSGLSHHGGNCLMAGTGFVFIFSPLLMLLTLVLYAPLAPIERYGCQTLEQPDRLDTAIKALLPILAPDLVGKSENWPAERLFNNDSIPLTIGGILQSCKDNDGIYTALKLDHLPQVKVVLRQLDEYKSKLNMTAEIENIHIDFSKMSIMNSETKDQMKNFTAALTKINFTNFDSQLTQNATSTDLLAFAASLRASNNAKLNESANDLEQIEKNEYKAVIKAKDDVLRAIRKLNESVNPLPALVKWAVHEAGVVDAYIRHNGTNTVKQQSYKFADRLLNITEQFLNKTLRALQQEVARCRPLYNIYHFNTQILCGNVVDTLNGIWLGLGWCVFLFMPSIIFAVKLSKHFRKMQYQETYDDSDASRNESAMEMQRMRSNTGSFGRKNKVGVLEPQE